jgi:hypothetical protein
MYEIDFLPVGEASRDGDAITIRFTHGDEYVVGVIDAGFTADGDAVVNHIKTWYETDVVDFVISTHPDDDHISGLPTVLKQLQVTNLLVHQPAKHAYVNDATVDELVALAQRQGTKVIEPFTGVGGFDGALLVAGPTEERYLQALQEQIQVVKEAQRQVTFAERFLGAATKVVRKTLNSFPTELFFDDEGGDPSARNHGAVIVSLMLDGKHILFPSDAGVPGINAAMDYLDSQGRTKNFPKLVTLPHHGSRHNFDRDTAQRVLGAYYSGDYGTAIASVAKESSRPRARIANAAGRRGYKVLETRGKTIRHHSSDAPVWAGWSVVTPLPPLDEND